MLAAGPLAAQEGYFEILVVDRETGRGVPLVELETVHNVIHVTDNAGRVALHEPGREGETIFFEIRPQGYRVPRDGFGIAGVRLKLEADKAARVELERINVAERLYRSTGQDLYRDSLLLGHAAPLAEPLGAGRVAGQDSVMVAPFRGKLYWFWGDTNRLSYPLGLFRTAGATSEPPGRGGLAPELGVDYRYFAGADGFARAMAELPAREGVIWLDGVCAIPDADADGGETLLAHYSRRKGLADALEQGMMRYNVQREMFESASSLPLEESWRFLQGHPIRWSFEGREYLASGGPFPVTRVPATVADALDPSRYESWTCLAEDANPRTAAPLRDAEGQIAWAWRAAPPVTSEIEQRWVERQQMRPEECRFLPEDAAHPGRRVHIHSGSVRWNEHRRRWVMIAIEHTFASDSPSMLGEVWYSEAESPQGPFHKAVRIATHDQQSFYNPCHHDFFDEQGGRVIYFEGTYCNTFTRSRATPRYNYNQLMYRLDLDHPALVAAFPR